MFVGRSRRCTLMIPSVAHDTWAMRTPGRRLYCQAGFAVGRANEAFPFEFPCAGRESSVIVRTVREVCGIPLARHRKPRSRAGRPRVRRGIPTVGDGVPVSRRSVPARNRGKHGFRMKIVPIGLKMLSLEKPVAVKLQQSHQGERQDLLFRKSKPDAQAKELLSRILRLRVRLRWVRYFSLLKTVGWTPRPSARYFK